MKEPVPAVCGRFHQAVELIGGRWTGAIVQTLLRGPSRYATIRSAIPDISDRMLSDRLRILESEAIVSREVLPEIPVRVEYRLTEKGRSLEGALNEIAHWAEQWISLPDVAGDAHPHHEAKQSPQDGASSVRKHSSLQHRAQPRIKPKV